MSSFIARFASTLISFALAYSQLVQAQAQINGVPVDLAKGNVLYHYLQDEPGNASLAALYAERTRVKHSDDNKFKQSLLLMRAGLALDMGDEAQAQGLLDQLSEGELTLLNKSRWHFQLARQAYRARDWAQLEQELAQIAPESRLRSSSRLLFLETELLCLQGEFDQAAEHIEQIDPDNVLSRYARFNLGLSAHRQGSMRMAESQLKSMIDLKVFSHEDLMLSDRARLVLANLKIEQDRTAEALDLLQRVTATDEYGPQAIANLVGLALREQRYSAAANYSRYLIDTTPWHSAARDAHVALPYALEKIHGSNQASGEYDESTQRLRERSIKLNDLLAQLESAPVDQLVEIALNSGAPGITAGSDSNAGSSLLEGIGHSDWIGWITSSKSQGLATDWHSLHHQVESLKRQREDLTRLLKVDTEQKRRNRVAADSLIAGGRVLQLEHQRSKTEELIATLDSILVVPNQVNAASADLSQLASEAELEELRYLSDLRVKANRLNADANILRRISRLEGLFHYRIQDELPVRAQKFRAIASNLLLSLDAMDARARRIQLASDNAEIHDRYSDRIATLESRTDNLIVRSQERLDQTGRALIAEVTGGVREELAGLDQQLVYLNLAMARIGDRQILAAGGRP